MGFIATKEEEEEEDAPQQENQQRQYFHVLAVDDNISDRKLLERLLQVSSYQVTCVDSGDKALEYLGLLDSHPNGTASSFSSSSSSPSGNQVSKVNMIMTDYCMPGMSGYDLLKRVKGSSWKHVPVVIMSSDNVPSRISMCLEGGADEFLLKPVQISDLERLQTHLLKSLACSHHDDGKHGGDGGGKRMAAMPPNARHKMKGSQPNNND